MNSTTKPNRDRALSAINIVVWGFMVAAAALSSTHIVETGQHLGLDWESWTLPLFVDGIAVVGKVSMLPRFSPAFRKSGFRLLMLGGSLSLAANVYAGHTLGQRLFGVLVVAGFMALEAHATKGSRSVAIAAPTEPEVDEELKAKRSASAKKAAATRKRNAATKDKAARVRAPKAAKRTLDQELEDIESLDDVAPKSPLVGV
jgi:hypothetical protein